ncbi:MAG: hypothetical protein MZV64_16655 [Ignavibacteriales bacterium]|nr:hypothetical protein [Ignavibacteriales bacterium]
MAVGFRIVWSIIAAICAAVRGWEAIGACQVAGIYLIPLKMTTISCPGRSSPDSGSRPGRTGT